jgi:hypothetical protein
MLELSENHWTQIGGDMCPEDHGGVFAKLDGDSVEVFEMDRTCDHVGHPFWKREAYYHHDGLAWSDDARQALDGLDLEGQEPEVFWNELPLAGKCDLLFAIGHMAEPAMYGDTGWADSLPSEPIYGWHQPGEVDRVCTEDDDARLRLAFIAVDDEYNRDELGKIEVYIFTTSFPGCLPEGEPTMVVGREAAAELVWDRVNDELEQAAMADEKLPLHLAAEWRSSPHRAMSNRGLIFSAELFHTIEVEPPGGFGNCTSNDAYEAADAICEAYNEGSKLDRDDFDEDVWEMIAGFPDSQELIESKPFHYETCCVESTAELINAMCDDAEEIDYHEFVVACDGVDEWAIAHGYAPAHTEGDLTLCKDWHVTFNKSTYDGRPCYFLQWSGIEYIWTAEGNATGWGYGSKERS